ncbi:MORN repeat protein [Dyadobacter jejuensis]|uniref:MORN repeat protein n=2 Tax=Dyadobacter jejuensis TaxID=1082580 RepID=A0A316ARS6_9BACT|nr:MORN repeat protein [Dyadobacter jejuensis]
MGRRALFRGSLSLWAFIVFLSCEPDVHYVLWDDARLLQSEQYLLLDRIPFSGVVLTLDSNKTDTLVYQSYKDGLEHGAWKQYYGNGQLKEKRFFDKGQKTGDYLAFWDDGSPMLAYQFREGEYEGTCREWNRDGQLILEMNYSKGHEKGNQKMYYDNGKIRANYTVVDGRRFGLLGTKNCINISDSVFVPIPLGAGSKPLELSNSTKGE